jgi:hypothetical protein
MTDEQTTVIEETPARQPDAVEDEATEPWALIFDPADYAWALSEREQDDEDERDLDWIEEQHPDIASLILAELEEDPEMKKPKSRSELKRDLRLLTRAKERIDARTAELTAEAEAARAVIDLRDRTARLTSAFRETGVTNPAFVAKAFVSLYPDVKRPAASTIIKFAREWEGR